MKIRIRFFSSDTLIELTFNNMTRYKEFLENNKGIELFSEEVL